MADDQHRHHHRGRLFTAPIERPTDQDQASLGSKRAQVWFDSDVFVLHFLTIGLGGGRGGSRRYSPSVPPGRHVSSRVLHHHHHHQTFSPSTSPTNLLSLSWTLTPHVLPAFPLLPPSSPAAPLLCCYSAAVCLPPPLFGRPPRRGHRHCSRSTDAILHPALGLCGLGLGATTHGPGRRYCRGQIDRGWLQPGSSCAAAAESRLTTARPTGPPPPYFPSMHAQSRRRGPRATTADSGSS